MKSGCAERGTCASRASHAGAAGHTVQINKCCVLTLGRSCVAHHHWSGRSLQSQTQVFGVLQASLTSSSRSYQMVDAGSSCQLIVHLSAEDPASSWTSSRLTEQPLTKGPLPWTVRRSWGSRLCGCGLRAHSSSLPLCS